MSKSRDDKSFNYSLIIHHCCFCKGISDIIIILWDKINQPQFSACCSFSVHDLSFKLNFPSANAGTFSLWFTGLIDNYRHDVPDPTEWKIMWDTSGSWSHQRSCAGGLTHTYRFKTGGSLNTNIAYTGSYSRLAQDDYTEQMQKMPIIDGRYAQWNIIISLSYTKLANRSTVSPTRRAIRGSPDSIPTTNWL